MNTRTPSSSSYETHRVSDSTHRESESTHRDSDTNFKRRRTDHRDVIDSDYESDSSEISMDFHTPIQKYSDHSFNNNWGQCPYCPKDGFRNVNVHIGHMHKCKTCKKLSFECKCTKYDLINPIRSFQSTLRYI